MVHAALLLLMLEAVTRTSFHHQPEAQHPKSLAIHKNAGRLPHLWVKTGNDAVESRRLLLPQKRTLSGGFCVSASGRFCCRIRGPAMSGSATATSFAACLSVL